MSQVIALFNQAGGVTKTTLCLNLGYALYQRKHRVLLVDTDPQASLTLFMGLNPMELPQTLYDALVEKQPLPIEHEIHGMDLVPANLNLSVTEFKLSNDPNRHNCLKQALAPILKQYDFILIDCSPSLGLLNHATLVAANYVLVPIQTQFKAFQSTDLLLNTIATVRRATPSCKVKIAGFIPTLYNTRTSQDARTLQAINEQLPVVASVYPPVPRSTAFADASENKMPLGVYNPKHPVLKTLRQIAERLEMLP
jgi:chromosome partitioning protein